MVKSKRGRPVGSKNKPKVPASIYKESFGLAKALKPFQKDVISDFQKTLDEWERMEKKTNWEEIAKKQEIELKVYVEENEDLAKICISRWEEIQHLKYLVSYLEKRLENTTV